MEGMIKTFHIATNSQLADIFTKALGFSSFAKLSEKLGLKDIFVPRQLKATSSIQVTELVVQDLRGSIEIEVMAKRQTGENDKRKKKTASISSAQVTCAKERKKSS